MVSICWYLGYVDPNDSYVIKYQTPTPEPLNLNPYPLTLNLNHLTL